MLETFSPITVAALVLLIALLTALLWYVLAQTGPAPESSSVWVNLYNDCHGHLCQAEADRDREHAEHAHTLERMKHMQCELSLLRAEKAELANARVRGIARANPWTYRDAISRIDDLQQAGRNLAANLGIRSRNTFDVLAEEMGEPYIPAIMTADERANKLFVIASVAKTPADLAEKLATHGFSVPRSYIAGTAEAEVDRLNALISDYQDNEEKLLDMLGAEWWPDDVPPMTFADALAAIKRLKAAAAHTVELTLDANDSDLVVFERLLRELRGSQRGLNRLQRKRKAERLKLLGAINILASNPWRLPDGQTVRDIQTIIREHFTEAERKAIDNG